MCEEYILRRQLFGMEVPSRHGVLVIPFEKISRPPLKDQYAERTGS